MKPLAIDLFCGLGGWSDGLLSEGYQVVGFDIEAHNYGDGKRYPAQLVIQDVLTIHGRQLKDAALIVASPPCQEYSYMAMPWSRAKGIAAEYRSGKRDVKKLTALFDACFRIQREAIEAAGHFIPLVVENVRGAQPWVGRARWNFGSYYLWGDVPALMPITFRGIKTPGRSMSKDAEKKWGTHNIGPADAIASELGSDGVKQGGNWFHDSTPGTLRSFSGVKTGGNSFFENGSPWMLSRGGPKSNARKAASATIAKIPLPLARWIAKVYFPNPLSPPVNQNKNTP